jgi:glycosyltransferase involved in cell wall biosynthesis
MITMATFGAVIPHFNDSHFIEGSLLAYLTDDRPPDRVLVVDDGSNDEQWRLAHGIITRLQQQFSGCLEFRRRPDNRGVISTLNEGLGAIGTDYVQFRAADDRSVHGYLRNLAGVLDRHPGAALAVGSIQYWNGMDDEGPIEVLGVPQDGFWSADALSRLIGADRIMHSATCWFNREKLLGVGGFAPDTDLYHDWWVCHQMAMRYGAVCLKQTAALFRLRGDSVSSVEFRNRVRAEQSWRALRQRLDREDQEVRDRFICSGLMVFFRNIETGDSTPDSCAFESLSRCEGGMGRVICDRLLRERRNIMTCSGRMILYGAGNHSRILAAIWQEIGLPGFSVVIQSHQPNSVETVFNGLLVQSVDDVEVYGVDLVVVSSKSFEEQMVELLKTRSVSASVLTVWNPSLTRWVS